MLHYWLSWHRALRRHGSQERRREPDTREAHLLHLLRSVQHGPDDHHSVQEVERDAVRGGYILGAPARTKVKAITQLLSDNREDMGVQGERHSEPQSRLS